MALSRADAQNPRHLLARILDAPHLARAIPALPPEVLHHLIQHCGLEESGDLLALATPEQLTRVFDHDLWNTAGPAGDPRFDPARFGLWLEVMVQSGAESAARTVAGLDADLVSTALAQHVRVFDYAAIAPYISLDGEEIGTRIMFEDHPHSEICGYMVVARRTDAWDAIVALLASLGESQAEFFVHVMRACVELSYSAPEIDGLDDLATARDQSMFDVEDAREQRLDAQGYVTPAQARAFLEGARRIDLRGGTTCPANDVARAYFRRSGTPPADRPELVVDTAVVDGASTDHHDSPSRDVAAVMDVLVEAGVVPQRPRALVAAPETDSRSRGSMPEYLQCVSDRDPVTYAARNAELAFLANTLMAGASLQARAFDFAEASAAAAAVCNLGLENWPAQWLPPIARGPSLPGGGARLPDDLLVGQDLIGVFQVGWTVLHENVGMRAAEMLIGSLTRLDCHDPVTRSDVEALLSVLTRAWRAGAPWRIGDRLEAIATLDLPTWIALVGLLGECPVIHAVVTTPFPGDIHRINADDFRFIATNEDLAVIERFLQSLPARLHE